MSPQLKPMSPQLKLMSPQLKLELSQLRLLFASARCGLPLCSTFSSGFVYAESALELAVDLLVG
jgi:hypothetical protein